MKRAANIARDWPETGTERESGIRGEIRASLCDRQTLGGGGVRSHASSMAHICKALATCHCVFRALLHMVLIAQPILQQGSEDSKK